MIQVSIEVNGKTVTADRTAPHLLDFIRDVAGLKGTHAGCDGVCGACTVLVEGNAIRSCLVLAVQADEQEVISIEGWGDLAFGELSIVQDAFCERTAFNAVIAHRMVLAEALLADTPNPTEGDMRGHFRQHLPLHWLCADCEAVMLAADRLANRNYKASQANLPTRRWAEVK